ncbi:NAD(P)/FAD-dependent oxidoreductase [Streptomyces natalensis]|nr:FAD-dependent monooxygenase [Streptomyces natalensis]
MTGAFSLPANQAVMRHDGRSTDPVGNHAVVLGAGIGGLLAARVLSGCFDRVTVVERDGGDGFGARRGVPQGRHLHALPLKTSQLLEELFPGLHAEYLADGAVTASMRTQYRIDLHGHTLHRPSTNQDTILASRPLLEHRIKERVRDLPGVTLRTGLEATGLIAPAATRVIGVVITPKGSRRTESLRADLVVDATGRSARSLIWLRELGYSRPPEQRVGISLAYATQVLRLPVDACGGDRVIAVIPHPARPQGVYLVAREDNCWSLTAVGYGSSRPSSTPGRFYDLVHSLLPADVGSALGAAEPVGDIHLMQIPHVFRRRFDRLSRFPAGLLVIGDALCSANPVYAGGIGAAASQAILLDRHVRRGLDGLQRRFFRDTARALAGPWWFTAVSDLSMPGVSGPRIPGKRLADWYLSRLAEAAAHDAELTSAFLQVASLLSPPSRLAHPAIVAKVLKPARGKK